MAKQKVCCLYGTGPPRNGIKERLVEFEALPSTNPRLIIGPKFLLRARPIPELWGDVHRALSSTDVLGRQSSSTTTQGGRSGGTASGCNQQEVTTGLFERILFIERKVYNRGPNSQNQGEFVDQRKKAHRLLVGKKATPTFSPSQNSSTRVWSPCSHTPTRRSRTSPEDAQHDGRVTVSQQEMRIESQNQRQ